MALRGDPRRPLAPGRVRQGGDRSDRAGPRGPFWARPAHAGHGGATWSATVYPVPLLGRSTSSRTKTFASIGSVISRRSWPFWVGRHRHRARHRGAWRTTPGCPIRSPRRCPRVPAAKVLPLNVFGHLVEVERDPHPVEDLRIADRPTVFEGVLHRVTSRATRTARRTAASPSSSRPCTKRTTRLSGRSRQSPTSRPRSGSPSRSSRRTWPPSR